MKPMLTINLIQRFHEFGIRLTFTNIFSISGPTIADFVSVRGEVRLRGGGRREQPEGQLLPQLRGARPRLPGSGRIFSL